MKIYKNIVCCILIAVALTFSGKCSGAAETFIVKDGKANAEIVISKNPERPRMAGLAALELQYYLEKMSGARLPIVTSETEDYPVKIYVGESKHTQELGIKTDNLKYSAFYINTGDNWLALVGKDVDFVPPKPFAKKRSDIKRAKEE
ncbi:MAG: hypothetical protein ACQETH_14535, partial [Candidatus Rifleibacteriota bacterium]